MFLVVGFLLVIGFLEEILHLDLHLGLHLDVAHLVDIREGEVTCPIQTLIRLANITLHQGTIALDIYQQVSHLDLFVTALKDGSLHHADWHFATTILLSNLSRALLVDIDTEARLQSDVADFRHLQDLAETEGTRQGIARDIMRVIIMRKIKIQTSCSRTKYSLELLTAVRDMDIAFESDIAEGAELIHHQLLYGKLVDYLLFHRALGSQLINVEEDVEVFLLLEVLYTAHGFECQPFVGRMHLDILEEEG